MHNVLSSEHTCVCFQETAERYENWPYACNHAQNFTTPCFRVLSSIANSGNYKAEPGIIHGLCSRSLSSLRFKSR